MGVYIVVVFVHILLTTTVSLLWERVPGVGLLG